LERIKTATGVTLKLKCSCGFGPFTCNETKADPCKCPECDSSDELEEIDTEKIGGGAIHHWKCKLGHTKHLSGKCSKGLAGCVADCVEADDDKPPECICPGCKKSDGLVTLGTTEVVYEGQKLTIRHLKCKCGFISGKCTEPAGKFLKEEAVECISVEPEEPKCPKCGKTHFRIVKTEEVEVE
jgi:transposase-like protein